MHTWFWQTASGLPHLRCSLLADWSHGFFGRQAWSHLPQHLTEVLEPGSQAFRLKQVHGNEVVNVTEAWSSFSHTSLIPGDGLLTKEPGQSLWVCSADCTPVLIADSQSGHVCAIHSGWRGTATQIVPKAIAHLQREGSELNNLFIALGPAISGTVYQVSIDVALQVISTLQGGQNRTTSELNHWLQSSNPPLFPDPESGKIRLDIRRVISLQLEQLGISPHQVASAPHCTYTQTNDYFSYRRDGLKQVQWSGIVSRW